ncbi:MAG: glycosyltransferase [Vampirovibrionales bacterium]|nr:glycosyltransferase [Vampirovibrionales bacterium]
MNAFKLAILTDHIANIGGAESILFNAVDLYPEADLLTVVHNQALNANMPAAVREKTFHTSFLQNFPFAVTAYKAYLPIMPLAVEALNVQAYDVLLSSHHSVIKGVIPRPDAVHLCYCHSPARYLWDQYWTYAEFNRLGSLAKFLVNTRLHPLRIWDVSSANRVDRFLANSNFTAKRIQKYYNRQAEVLFPPVETQKFKPSPPQADYYLMVGRLVAYKGFELAIDVFNRLKLPLVIIGDGPEYRRLKQKAGETVTLRRQVSQASLIEHFEACRGFIFPGKEDFGIAMVEAQAAGKAVIALQAGGALDIVQPDITGVLAPEFSESAFVDAIQRAQRIHWDVQTIARHADTFDKRHFRSRLKTLIDWAAETRQSRKPLNDIRL